MLHKTRVLPMGARPLVPEPNPVQFSKMLSDHSKHRDLQRKRGQFHQRWHVHESNVALLWGG